jgi:hypothetical protein
MHEPGIVDPSRTGGENPQASEPLGMNHPVVADPRPAVIEQPEIVQRSDLHGPRIGHLGAR